MINLKFKIRSYSTFVQYLTKSLCYRSFFKEALLKRRCSSKRHIVEFEFPAYNLSLRICSDGYEPHKKMQSMRLKQDVEYMLQRLERFIKEYDLKEIPFTKDAAVLDYDIDNRSFKYRCDDIDIDI